jgi:hypothetical protein
MNNRFFTIKNITYEVLTADEFIEYFYHSGLN